MRDLGNDAFFGDAGVFPIESIASRFVVREHDAALEYLIQSGSLGNVLLVGERGTGKTASLRMLAFRNAEKDISYFRVDPLGGEMPLTHVNLIDDVFLLPSQRDHGKSNAFNRRSHFERLIAALQEKVPSRLNILASTPVAASDISKQFPIDKYISLNDLSNSEINQLFQRYAFDGKSKNIDQMSLEKFISQSQSISPRELLELVQATVTRELSYVAPVNDRILEMRRPRLIAFTGGMLSRLEKLHGDLHSLTPQEFEGLVAELFERDGYSVTLTKNSRDGGVDIFARRRDIGGEFLTVVQCKKYAKDNPVRVHFVREIAGVVNFHNATAGAIFTTSRFTKDAIAESQKMNYRLSLTDYFGLTKAVAKLRYK